ncbi:MAG: SufS family cysteine desulfurase [bacterium]|jgi:cysteine desulfurase / selenocysteine lyase
MAFDVYKIRKDFPILQQEVNGKPLIYLDNAATTQKPDQVIERITRFYKSENSNVHRGVHALSQAATEAYEQARRYTAGFIHAESEKEVIFTRGTTESINFISTVLDKVVMKGDDLLVSAMEHHSNLVPWQQLCERKGAVLKIIPVNKSGELNLDALGKMLTPRTKILAVAHISNVLGTINPIREIADLAHELGTFVVVDGAQATAHTPIDVREMDCDFYALSAHKAYGPTGIGVLYAKSNWLQLVEPYQYGGEMVDQVSYEKATFNELPFRFEAGTPNVEGAVAMESALRYIDSAGIGEIRKYEDQLLERATRKLENIEGVRIIGRARNKTAVLSFGVEGLHPYDLGTLLDQMGIAVRTGYHCAQPLIESFGMTGTLRASFAMYNTFEEVDIFISSLQKAIQMLRA